ncbi:MAG: hypothetical protein ABWZ80_02120 [Beijerinckiaceae bacterium]
MTSLIDRIAFLPDLAILALGAAFVAALALGVAWVAHRFWFADRLPLTDAHVKIADLVHGSLLAFTVFVLALALTDVRANLGRADDAALREASTIARLDRELEALGPEAATARQKLKSYARAVLSDEWATLSRSPPTLSAAAQSELSALVQEARRLANAHAGDAGSLRTLTGAMEDLRQGRLEFATKSVPGVFWWMIAAFVLGTMAMYGRNPMDATGAALIIVHMAAIGLVIALIIVMDEPFRGQTSISSVPIGKAAGL